MIPYAQHSIDDDDVEAVADAMRSGHLAQGPACERFERELGRYLDVPHVVAVSSGTTALEIMLASIPHRVRVVPAITFAASAARSVPGEVRIADVDPVTGLMDAEHALSLASGADSVIVLVHLGGRRAPVPDADGIRMVDDACHALGGDGLPRKKSLATVYSFHPAKHITTGEGGAIVTYSRDRADAMRAARDPRKYTNGRMSELHAALGLSQLKKAAGWLERRRALALAYDVGLAGLDWLRRPEIVDGHAWHLYAVHVPATLRERLREHLTSRGVGTQVHYKQLRDFFIGGPDLPGARAYAASTLSLPLFPTMTAYEHEHVIDAVRSFAP